MLGDLGVQHDAQERGIGVRVEQVQRLIAVQLLGLVHRVEREVQRVDLGGLEAAGPGYSLTGSRRWLWYLLGAGVLLSVALALRNWLVRPDAWDWKPLAPIGVGPLAVHSSLTSADVNSSAYGETSP